MFSFVTAFVFFIARVQETTELAVSKRMLPYGPSRDHEEALISKHFVLFDFYDMLVDVVFTRSKFLMAWTCAYIARENQA